MAVYIDGRVLFPSHTAADYLVFRQAQAVRPGEARLVISIDGVERITNIEILPHDSPASRIPIRIVASCPQ
jgi:hypothetical protein